MKLIDSGVDIVLHCTPPHFRPAHFAAAVAAGKHSFLEKPIAVDPTGVRAVLATAEQAAAKGLSVMTGTQLRREASRIEVRNRVLDGAIGDVLSVRAFRNQGALWYRTRQDGWSDMEFMIRDWVNWNWLSGDHIVEQHIHHLDGMIWVMGKAPVKAVGMGGRVRRQTGDQYDFFSVDYTFDNGVHMHSTIRQDERMREPARRDAGRHQGAAPARSGRGFRPRRQGGGSSRARATTRWCRSTWTLSGPSGPARRSRRPETPPSRTLAGRSWACKSAYTGKAVLYDELMASTMRLGPETYALGPVNIPAVPPLAGQESAPLSAVRAHRPGVPVNHRDTEAQRRTEVFPVFEISNVDALRVPNFPCASLCFRVSVVDECV